MTSPETYDPKCYELASYFLEGCSPELNREQVRQVLASWIQDCVTAFMKGAEEELLEQDEKG